jgi:hypothetical protein
MKNNKKNNNNHTLPNLRDSESSAAKDVNTLTKLTMKDLLDVCGGGGPYQGRRSNGGYVPT